MPFSNGLSKSEVERLAILAEEMGEAQQVIGKILRHGYESYNPFDAERTPNKTLLENELGDVLHAIARMGHSADVSLGSINARSAVKAIKIRRFLHHQSKSGFDSRFDAQGGGHE